MKSFIDAMNEAPAPLQHMPAMNGDTDVAKAWQDAVSGRAPERGFADTRAAAKTWLNQPFGTDAEMDVQITVGKA
jgi:hypothetical protein